MSNHLVLSAEDKALISAFIEAKNAYMSAMTAAWAPIREKLDEIERDHGMDAAVRAACALEFDSTLKVMYLSNKFKEQDALAGEPEKKNHVPM